MSRPNRIELSWHLSESEAIMASASPEPVIKEKLGADSFSERNRGGDTFKGGRRSFVTGDAEREDLVYPVQFDIIMPGFIQKAMARVKGREPQALGSLHTQEPVPKHEHDLRPTS